MQKFRDCAVVRGFLGGGCVALTAALVACGGGGGGTTATAAASGPAPSLTWPTSGYYSPIIKPQGAPRAVATFSALSFAHPSNPTVEYVVDGGASQNSFGQLLEKGVYNAATQQFTGLTPVAFVDSPNGDFRTTSMIASGARPAQVLGSSLVSCGLRAEAKNYTTPYASQFLLATPGRDRICDTADDTETQLNFVGADGRPSSFELSSGTSLGYLRSTSTGLPTFLFRVFPNGSAQVIDNAGNGVAINVLPAASPATSAVAHKSVQSLSDIIVYTRNGALMAVNGRTTVPTVVSLSSVVGPNGWSSAGYDGNNVYSYLNSSATSSGLGNWRILATSRSTLTTATFAVGIGAIQNASISGNSVLYTTVLSGNAVSVFRIPTATGLVTPYLTSTTSAVLVSTSENGAHILTNISGTSLISTQVVNDAGTVLYTANGGLIYGADLGTAKNSVSDVVESTGHLFATPFVTGAALGGSPVTRYDVATQLTRTLGVLPTGASLGGSSVDGVFATPLLAKSGFGGLYAARVVSAVLQTTGAAVYTYNTGVANSLTLTTSQVK